MKGVKQKEMTTQDMAAALLMVNGATPPGAAVEVGLHERVLRNRMKAPYFIAYMDELRAKKSKELEAQAKAASRKIDFSLADAVDILAKIAREGESGPVTVFARIKAIEVLAKLLRWGPDGASVSDGEAAHAKPDVYQAEWMRKPQ